MSEEDQYFSLPRTIGALNLPSMMVHKGLADNRLSQAKKIRKAIGSWPLFELDQGERKNQSLFGGRLIVIIYRSEATIIVSPRSQG